MNSHSFLISDACCFRKAAKPWAQDPLDLFTLLVSTWKNWILMLHNPNYREFSGCIELSPHAIARDQAIAKRPLRLGEVLMRVEAASFVLLHEEKGKRCDACCRALPLRRCSRCASYWYCSETCESIEAQELVISSWGIRPGPALEACTPFDV